MLARLSSPPPHVSTPSTTEAQIRRRTTATTERRCLRLQAINDDNNRSSSFLRSSSSPSRTWTTPRCFAPCGYRKVPLETEGAYRLIDEATGKSVIVWGDDETDVTDTSAIRSLFSEDDAHAAVGSGRRAIIGVESFGKLKAQKVRALQIRRSVANARRVRDELSESDDDAVDERSSSIRSRAASSASNFVRRLRGQPETSRRGGDDDDEEEEKEEEGEDGILSMDSSKAASSSLNGRRGWGAGKTSSFGSKQQRKKDSYLTADRGFFSRKSFKELGCSDDVVEALRKLQFIRPSHIQAMSYAPILEGKSCIIADQSGSGKTLAYLAPIIQQLRQEEILGISKSASKNPRVVILVPTAELASQVLYNCRGLAKHGIPFRSMVATGGFRQKTQLESLQQELDVLIATPGRFLYLLKEGFLELANLKCVVLDEVDILFSDEEFEDDLKHLISCAPVSTQYLFVTATLPVDIYHKLVEVFPDSEVVMGPGVHRTSSGLEEVLVDCSGEGEEKNPDTAFTNKKSALLRLVEESPVNRTIVFCNKIETCRKVENALKRYDRKGTQIQVLPFHSALEPELRLSNMKEFLTCKSNDRLFLLCTDRASRGIDFKDVDHVVLFDFPRDPSEYVRRVGRVARGAGGKGKAFVFAVGKQVPLARRIMERNQKGHPLHNVPC